MGQLGVELLLPQEVVEFQMACSTRDQLPIVQALAGLGRAGALSFLLGSGVSKGSGVPIWKELIAEVVGAEIADATDLPGLLQTFVQEHCDGSQDKLDGLLEERLYRDAVPSHSLFRNQSLLGITAVVSALVQRTETVVIGTFNWDELTEEILRAFGISVESIPVVERWAGNGNVKVIHIHGFFPRSGNPDGRAPSVSHRYSYSRSLARVLGGDTLLPFTKRIAILMGIGDDDSAIAAYLTKMQTDHPVSVGGTNFWAVMFCTVGDCSDHRARSLEQMGIYPFRCNDYHADVPEWLFRLSEAV